MKDYRENITECCALILLFLMFVLCFGEPDILDGLIKMANQ